MLEVFEPWLPNLRASQVDYLIQLSRGFDIERMTCMTLHYTMVEYLFVTEDVYTKYLTSMLAFYWLEGFCCEACSLFSL